MNIIIMESDFEYLKLHGTYMMQELREKEYPTQSMVVTPYKTWEKKEDAGGVGRGAPAATRAKEKEVDDPTIDAIVSNHFIDTPSGKGIWEILLPSGWYCDFQVGHNLLSIVMLHKVPKVMPAVKKLLGQHGVDEITVHGDALVISINEWNDKDMNDQGVNMVEYISNNFILWHLPFKICEELFIQFFDQLKSYSVVAHVPTT
jgi:hypothetical protein